MIWRIVVLYLQSDFYLRGKYYDFNDLFSEPVFFLFFKILPPNNVCKGIMFSDSIFAMCISPILVEVHSSSSYCLVMARYGRGGKRWIRYDTAQNIAIRYDTIRYTAPKCSAICNVQQD